MVAFECLTCLVELVRVSPDMMHSFHVAQAGIAMKRMWVLEGKWMYSVRELIRVLVLRHFWTSQKRVY